MKKVFSFLLALTLLLSIGITAFAVVEPSDRFYVADYANVLSESTENDIINYNGALEYQCQGAQLVVVTVDYLEGMTSDAYAYQLMNDWGVGSAQYNNGMLLLLGVQENKAWLAYGLGLSSQLSESKVDELLDAYFWTDFDKGNYDRAVSSLFSALLRWYDGVYGSNVASAGNTGSETVQYNSYPQSSGSGSGSLIRAVILILILLALSGGLGGRRRGGLGGILPWLFLFNSRRGYGSRRNWGDWPPRGGGFGGSGRGGGFGGGFGGGMGRGGGGFSGGGGGRR